MRPLAVRRKSFKRDTMKNKFLSSIFFLLASVCYFISAWISISEGIASGYRFYLQILTGILFFIASCRMFIKSRKENKTEVQVK
jgi:TRAP-type C4-dicarboxylate transport system permease small subunit